MITQIETTDFIGSNDINEIMYKIEFTSALIVLQALRMYLGDRKPTASAVGWIPNNLSFYSYKLI